MTIRIVSDNGEVVPPPLPHNPDVVAHLERLLELARDGKVTMFAFVASGAIGMERGYAGIDEVSDSVLALGLVSRLERMVHDRDDALSAPIVEFREP
jgi:hypothetical protein